MASQQAAYFKVAIKDHTMQVIKGSSSTKQAEIQVNAGESVDTILCADQDPGFFGGSYPITYSYVADSSLSGMLSVFRMLTSCFQ